MEVLKLYNEKDLDLNLKATELRLGLPGTEDEPEKQVVKSNKRSSTDNKGEDDKECALPPKAQVIGWPPVRSYRKNAFQQKKVDDQSEEVSGIYVKVSMDGAPFLRKIDLKLYKSYNELVKGLESMFKCTILGDYYEKELSGNYNKICNNGSDYALTYEDKDGDWMLVGDVPWDMFLTSCKRMRIMKGSDANGLGCL